MKSSLRFVTTHLRVNSKSTSNITFAIGGVMLRIKISGKNPAHLKSAKRCR